MPALNLSRLSKVPPMPNTTDCGGGGPTGYTCHAAALHWAFMDQGCSQIQANQRVTRITKATCGGCTTPGMPHGSIAAARYGQIFCSTGQRMFRNMLHTNLQPGDLLITGHPSMPNHSMIVRQVRGADHITVRGFNNIGTLGTGALLQYDDTSHNITKDKYWASPTMFGVHRPGIPLYRVPYANFSMQVALSMNMTI